MKKTYLALALTGALVLGACTKTPPPEPPPPPPPPPGAISGSVAADTNGDGIVDGYYTSDGVYHANPLPPPPS